MIPGRNISLFCVALVALAMLSLPPMAYAQVQRAGGNTDTNGQKKSQNDSKRRLRPGTYIVIQKAIKLQSEKKYDEARQELAKLHLDKLKPFGVSRVELVYANIDSIQQNYASARRHLQKALASGGLDKEESSRVRMNVAQSYLIEKNWAAAAKTLEEWFRHAKQPDSKAYFLLAIAYYRQDKFDKALSPARNAVEYMKTPDASKLRLLLALYVKRKDYKKAIEVAKQMVATWPRNKSYWPLLASLYMAADNADMALAAMQVAYNAGYLTEDSQYQRLADMLQYNHVSLRCARILSAAIASGTLKPSVDTYKRLGNCWVAAREFRKSLEPLGRAAHLSNNGKLYVRLAEAQLQNEDWKAVVSAIQKAIDKGKLEDEAHAQFLMGIALFKQHELAKARRWFQRAARDKNYRDNATAYIRAIKACNAQPDANWCS